MDSGDDGANASPALAALHTLWLRQHNRLAGRLLAANPLWDDETLFQETRRIVGAQIQHINYAEFLPAVLGQSLVDSARLAPVATGRSGDYDIDARPQAFHAAATAAMAFALTMLPATLLRYNTVRPSVRLFFFLFHSSTQFWAPYNDLSQWFPIRPGS